MLYGLIRGRSFSSFCHARIAHYVRAYVRNIYIRDDKIERARRRCYVTYATAVRAIPPPPPPVHYEFAHTGGPRELVARVVAQARYLAARDGWESWRFQERADGACRQGLAILERAHAVAANTYVREYERGSYGGT